eukprot:Ihof_evm6s229 gene=Ihof_evmTU6s229
MDGIGEPENVQREHNVEFTVDPEQSEQERRQIRQNYRHVLNRMEASKHELIQPGNIELERLLRETNDTFQRVHHPKEVFLDSMVLAQAATLGAQKAQLLNSSKVSFEPGLFATRLLGRADADLLAQIDDVMEVLDRDFWQRLGKESMACMPGRTAGMEFMLGPISYEKPTVQRQQREKKTKDTHTGPMVQPENITDRYKAGQESTTKEVQRILGYAQRLEEPMGLFSFIVNPTSFCATVENIFHLAFLVKEGYVQISLDEDGLPMIGPAEPPAEEGQGCGDKHQLVLEISMAEWK